MRVPGVPRLRAAIRNCAADSMLALMSRLFWHSLPCNTSRHAIDRHDSSQRPRARAARRARVRPRRLRCRARRRARRRPRRRDGGRAHVEHAHEPRRPGRRHSRRPVFAAHREAPRRARQFGRRDARSRQAMAACAQRPAGDQGGGRDVRGQHARARDRGAGARRSRESRERAPRDRRGHRRQPVERAARVAGSGAPQGRPDRAEGVVAVPRGGYRPRRRDLHQVAAHVGRRYRGRHRHPSEVGVEQPGARDRARRERARPHGRRDARQRRQPARLRGTQRAAARQGQGQQRVVRDRPVHPAVRRALHASTTCARATSRCASKAPTASCSTARARSA